MNAIRGVGSWQSIRSGFTIIELLIVVVVIAILAAIALVAFNGITKRATNTQIADTVGQYRKALALYKVDYGTLPLMGGPTTAGFCLGKGYPNYDGDPEGDCINDHDFDAFNFNEDNAIHTALTPYISSLPTIQREGFLADGHRFNGLLYMYDPYIRIDNVWAQRAIIFYYVQGANQDCQVPVLRYVGSGSNTGVGGNPSDFLFERANPNKYSFSNGYATACAFALD